MSIATRFKTLITREFAEYRRSFLYAPFIIASIVFALMLLSLATNGAFKVNNLGMGGALLGKVQELGADKLAVFHQGWMLGFYVIFHISCGVVMVIYLLGCLFDERKDRSTLFWRSMPVQDWESVLSKALVACFLIPAFYLVALVVLQLAFLCLMVILCWQNNISALELVWTPMPFFRTQLVQVALLYFSYLWALPIIGWLMLCSAFAKRRPFLLAFFVPGVAALAMYLLNIGKTFSYVLGGSDAVLESVKMFFSRVASLFIPSFDGKIGEFVDMDSSQSLVSIGDIVKQITNIEGVLGVLIGVALMYTAAWVRRYREDTAS